MTNTFNICVSVCMYVCVCVIILHVKNARLQLGANDIIQNKPLLNLSHTKGSLCACVTVHVSVKRLQEVVSLALA